MEQKCIKIFQSKVFTLVVTDIPPECKTVLNIINVGSQTTGDITEYFNIQENIEGTQKSFSFKPPFPSSLANKHITQNPKKEPCCKHILRITILDDVGNVVISKELVEFVIICRNGKTANITSIYHTSLFDVEIETYRSPQLEFPSEPTLNLQPSVPIKKNMPTEITAPKPAPNNVPLRNMFVPNLPTTVQRIPTPTHIPLQYMTSMLPLRQMRSAQDYITPPGMPAQLPSTTQIGPLPGQRLASLRNQQNNMRLRLQNPNNSMTLAEWKNKEIYNKMVSILFEDDKNDKEIEENNNDSNEKKDESDMEKEKLIDDNESKEGNEKMMDESEEENEKMIDESEEENEKVIDESDDEPEKECLDILVGLKKK